MQAHVEEESIQSRNEFYIELRSCSQLRVGVSKGQCNLDIKLSRLDMVPFEVG